MKFKICLYFWGVFGPWRGSVASYTTDERAKNGQKERWRLNLAHIAGIFKIYAWKSGGSFWGFDFRCTTDFTFPRAGWKPKGARSPRASEAAPWVGLSLVKPFTPWKGKSVDIVLLFRIPSAFMFLRFCPFRAWILYFCFTYPGCRFACPGLGAPLGFQPA